MTAWSLALAFAILASIAGMASREDSGLQRANFVFAYLFGVTAVLLFAFGLG